MSIERNVKTMHTYFDVLFGKNMDDLLNLYVTSGTLKGDVDFSTAKVTATGRTYELQCCFVFHFNDQGLIDKVREYFDMATVERFAPVKQTEYSRSR